MQRCMCGSKPQIKIKENEVEIFCSNCTRPHAYGKTKREARRE